MRLSRCELRSFQDGSDGLVVESKHLVQQFTIFNMVTLLVSIELHGVRDHLLLCNVFEDDEILCIFAIEVAGARAIGLIIEETRSTTM